MGLGSAVLLRLAPAIFPGVAFGAGEGESRRGLVLARGRAARTRRVSWVRSVHAPIGVALPRGPSLRSSLLPGPLSCIAVGRGGRLGLASASSLGRLGERGSRGWLRRAAGGARSGISNHSQGRACRQRGRSVGVEAPLAPGGGSGRSRCLRLLGRVAQMIGKLVIADAQVAALLVRRGSERIALRDGLGEPLAQRLAPLPSLVLLGHGSGRLADARLQRARIAVLLGDRVAAAPRCESAALPALIRSCHALLRQSGEGILCPW